MAEQINYSKGRGKRYVLKDLWGTGVNNSGYVTVAHSNMKQFCFDKGRDYKSWQKSVCKYNEMGKPLPILPGWHIEAIV